MLHTSMTNDELIRALEESENDLCQEAARRLWAVDPVKEKPSVEVKDRLKELKNLVLGAEAAISDAESEIGDIGHEIAIMIKECED